MRNYAWKGHRWNSTELLEDIIAADSLEEATRELRRQSFIVQSIEPYHEAPSTPDEAIRQHEILNPEKSDPGPKWYRGATQPRLRPPSAWQKSWHKVSNSFRQTLRRLYYRFLTWLHQRTWSDQQRVLFHLQMGCMLDSGVSLTRAIETQRHYIGNPWVQDRLKKILESGDFGPTLINSELFLPFERAQLKVALESATLPETYQRLAAQGEKILKYHRGFLSRLLQPLMTLALLYLLAPMVGYLVGTLLLCVADLKENSSLMTPAGHFLTSGPWLAFAWGFPVLLTFFSYRALQSRLRSSQKKNLLTLPWIGKIWWNYDLAHGLATFASLIDSGFPINQALSLTQQISLSDCWTRMLEAALQGQPLSAGLAGPFAPKQELCLQKAFHAGEESGTLPKLCFNLQSGLEAEATYQLDQTFHLLEPLLGLVVAGLVCGLCLLVLSPMREILQSL